VIEFIAFLFDIDNNSYIEIIYVETRIMNITFQFHYEIVNLDAFSEQSLSMDKLEFHCRHTWI
jgi:hypothetical protein